MLSVRFLHYLLEESCLLDHSVFSLMLIFQSIPFKNLQKAFLGAVHSGREAKGSRASPGASSIKSFLCLMLRHVGVSPRRSVFLTPPLSECRIRLCPWRALKLTARDTINAFPETEMLKLWLYVTLPSLSGSAAISNIHLKEGSPQNERGVPFTVAGELQERRRARLPFQAEVAHGCRAIGLNSSFHPIPIAPGVFTGNAKPFQLCC